MFDRLREDIEQIETIRNYKDAVIGLRNKTQHQNHSESRYPSKRFGFKDRIKQDLTSRSFNKNGHMRCKCPKRIVRRCYSCDSKNYLQQNCDKVRCFRCNIKGHKKAKCRSNEPRRTSVRNEPRLTGTNRYERIRSHDWKEYQDRKHSRRRINAIEEVEIEYSKTEDEITVSYRNRKYMAGSINSKKSTHDHPNDRDPSEVELIGALN